ncbi:MAG: hypothetical protein WDN04_21440 [Rhodospirillales bacterium]
MFFWHHATPSLDDFDTDVFAFAFQPLRKRQRDAPHARAYFKYFARRVHVGVAYQAAQGIDADLQEVVGLAAGIDFLVPRRGDKAVVPDLA